MDLSYLMIILKRRFMVGLVREESSGDLNDAHRRINDIMMITLLLINLI